MMTVDPLIRRIPQSAEDLETLRQEILDNQFARDIVVSSDSDCCGHHRYNKQKTYLEQRNPEQG
ncbi:MAG: hypothetical protein R2758_14195 [Bacteroidales bacterium]